MLLTVKQMVDENDIGYYDFKDTLDGSGIDTFACIGICEIDDEGSKQKLADALVRDTGLDLSEVVNYNRRELPPGRKEKESRKCC